MPTSSVNNVDVITRVKCYLCSTFMPKDETELVPYRVESSGRGGTIQGVIRYVRMCRHGYGCKT